MRILIADDHPVARRGLDTLLREAFPSAVITGVGTTAEALRIAALCAPELIVLDLRIPGPPTTAQLCRALRGRGITCPITIFTAFEDLYPIKQCIEAGAEGCLLKDAEVTEIIAALRILATGRTVLDPRIAAALADDAVTHLRSGAAAELSTRETEVLQLLAEGLSNRAIAERLYLAETTIKGYVGTLLEKLSASSRLHAVVRGKELELLR